MADTTLKEVNEAKKQIEDKELRRYALSVVSGQEFIVVENLKERAKKQGLESDIVDCLVPVVQEIAVAGAKKAPKMKKIYPGYVFVKSRMNEKIWYVIRNTPGVRIIVGAETRPVPLTEDEYQAIIKHVQERNERAELKVPFRVGDIVILQDGNFSGTKGVVKEVDAEKGFLVANIEILGRLTPVSVTFDKVEFAS